MDNTPLVIFRTTARNAEKTIERTVKSIYEQTHANWELHMVDNASDDNTLAIMEKYAAGDSRIRVFKNEGNYVWKKGNRFTDYYNEYDTENTYMCQIDADDEYKPGFASKMLDFAIKYNLDIACCGYECIDSETGEKLDELRAGETLLIEGDGFGTYFPAYHRFARIKVAKLYKLTIMGGFKVSKAVDMIYGGDTAETLEYFRNARRVGICPEQYYIYYYYRSSISKKWIDSRPEDDRTLQEATINYLIAKTGEINKANKECLHRVFYYAIRDSIEVLLKAQITFDEKIAALHDIIASRYTGGLVDYMCTSDDTKKPDDKVFRIIINWIVQNEAELKNQNTINKVIDILAVIDVFSADYSGLGTVVKGVMINENAGKVLEISGFDDKYCKLLKKSRDYLPANAGNIKVDRVDLTDSKTIKSRAAGGMYDNVYGSNILSETDKLTQYDVIIVFHLFENMNPVEAKLLLQNLLRKAAKQVLLITPQYPYDLKSEDEDKLSDIRAYHPLFFRGMDFSYALIDYEDEVMQAYSLFPVPEYEELPCDIKLKDGESAGKSGNRVPVKIEIAKEQKNNARKLNIAYIIAHHSVTGAMKAIYYQMNEFAKSGHRVTAYFKNNNVSNAIPKWIGLPDAEVKKMRQVVMPLNADYLEHIHGDEDVIILPMGSMVNEFKDSKIPVALWEQGHMVLFGDHGKLIGSNAQIRAFCHYVYRMPVYMLAVSGTISAILKGVYNRESLFYPLGIDTDFYYPNPGKNNDIPVILLVGNPVVVYKGLEYAFDVLNTAYELGMNFKVRLITQDTYAPKNRFLYDFEQFVSPQQEVIAEIYRNADILLSTSLYESFALPPLEAMASGTAVIATDSGGINTYAEPGVNCLLCEQGDTRSILYSLGHLLEQPDARERLAKAGRETALRFKYSEILPIWEECLYKITGK